ncbi:hypothetical protein EI94DRAFT_1910189 [Lactarius quietus]|nr:hypothetical protein EI94DRAFT_1910189 [Lactarius quietus]
MPHIAYNTGHVFHQPEAQIDSLHASEDSLPLQVQYDTSTTAGLSITIYPATIYRAPYKQLDDSPIQVTRAGAEYLATAQAAKDRTQLHNKPSILPRTTIAPFITLSTFRIERLIEILPTITTKPYTVSQLPPPKHPPSKGRVAFARPRDMSRLRGSVGF